MPLSERDRRTLVIGGIVIGVLLVALVLVNVLGGEGTPPGGVTARPTESGPGTVTPTTSPSPTGGTTTPPGGSTGRDPFSIPPGFSVAPTNGGTTTTPPPSNGTTTTTTTTSPPPTQPTGGMNMGGHEVVLLDVFTVNGNGAVDVEVDGVVYNVLEGETFGPNDSFELLSTSGNCATFRFGDDSFSLCVNPQK